MYSTFAFPGVKELNKKIKVLDVAAFISTFRVTLVNNKTQRRLLPGARTGGGGGFSSRIAPVNNPHPKTSNNQHVRITTTMRVN